MKPHTHESDPGHKSPHPRRKTLVLGAHEVPRSPADEDQVWMVRASRPRMLVRAAVALAALGALTSPVGAQDDGATSECEEAPKDSAAAKNSDESKDDEETPAVDCEPPPPQVSLAYLRSPAPTATDAELQAALESVDFLDTWYGLTPTNARLSLVPVQGAAADLTRQSVLTSIDELVDTRETVTQLLEAAQEAVTQQRSVRAEIDAVDETLTGLDADQTHTESTLANLRHDLAVVEGVLRDAAVGMYISSQPSGVTAIDDIGNYNLAQELAENVDLTVEELLGQRQDLEQSISNEENSLATIKASIRESQRERADLVVQDQNISDTIDRLTARIADLTARRIEIEAELPIVIAQAHSARLTASAPVMGIRLVTLDSYVQAAATITQYYPSCAIRWELIAGIANIESGHSTFGGAVVGPDGNVSRKILGPLLDGTLEGTAVIDDTEGGRLDGSAEFDRAIGPFQFLPGTWRGYGLDATGDGIANPHNVYDAALSAAGYLCTSSSLASDGGIARSVLSYNASAVYLADVTGSARNYIVSLLLPEAAYDPATLVVQDGWGLLTQRDEWEQIGYVGRPSAVVNTGD